MLPERIYRNLQILVLIRRLYFSSKGLPPHLLTTSLSYISEYNRIPVTKAVIPIFMDDNRGRTMLKAIEAQGDKWEPPELYKSPWTMFRKLQELGPIVGPVDDLLQLDYAKLLNGLNVPNTADIGKFWGGVADFLTNAWSVLEEFRLMAEIERGMEKLSFRLNLKAI